MALQYATIWPDAYLIDVYTHCGQQKSSENDGKDVRVRSKFAGDRSEFPLTQRHDKNARRHRYKAHHQISHSQVQHEHIMTSHHSHLTHCKLQSTQL